VAMRDLRVSDNVFVGGGNTDDHYQSVYAFGHHDVSTPTVYLRIHTTAGIDPLEISAAHLLYVKGKPHPVRADTIRPGQDVFFHRDNNGTAATTVTVTRVNTITRPGAFMPLTAKGTIVVNSIKASTYVSIMENAPEVVNKVLTVVSEDQLLHGWLAPYRIFCLQVAPSLCHNNYQEGEEGIAHWLLFGKILAEFGDNLGWFGQALGLVVVGIFIRVCMALEAVGIALIGMRNPVAALVAGCLLHLVVSRKSKSTTL